MKRFTLLTPLFFITSLHATASNDITLDTPRAGWRGTGSSQQDFTQAVHYPANSVSVDTGQDDYARIRGMIGNQPKTTKPARLVVNGVAMPIRIDQDGTFDRPYAFPAGSNSVEVRSPDGNNNQQVQFYATHASGIAARLRVVLSWSSDNTDIDLHMITPDGSHVWYGNRVSPNGGALDVDVTTGYGPEIFATPTPLPGRYLVYVNYYGGYHNYTGEDENEDALTTVNVSIISEEGTLNEKRETFLVPMRKSGELTLIKSFVYP